MEIFFSKEKSSIVTLPCFKSSDIRFGQEIRHRCFKSSDIGFGQEFRHRSLSVVLTMTRRNEFSIFSMLGIFFISMKTYCLYRMYGCTWILALLRWVQVIFLCCWYAIHTEQGSIMHRWIVVNLDNTKFTVLQSEVSKDRRTDHTGRSPEKKLASGCCPTYMTRRDGRENA